MAEDDILTFRRRENVDSDVRKRKRELDDSGQSAPRRLTDEEEKERVLAALAQDNAKGEDFDIASLRKMVLGFEKKGMVEMDLSYCSHSKCGAAGQVPKRAKQISRFRDEAPRGVPPLSMRGSHLPQAVQELQVIATNPSLYPEVLRLGVLTTILGLFAHDNVDIVAAAIEVISVTLPARSSYPAGAYRCGHGLRQSR
jgi:hypothetical protein